MRKRSIFSGPGLPSGNRQAGSLPVSEHGRVAKGCIVVGLTREVMMRAAVVLIACVTATACATPLPERQRFVSELLPTHIDGVWDVAWNSRRAMLTLAASGEYRRSYGKNALFSGAWRLENNVLVIDEEGPDVDGNQWRFRFVRTVDESQYDIDAPAVESIEEDGRRTGFPRLSFIARKIQ
jgi:hypothetical protein